MKGLSPIDIHRNLIVTLGMNILGYSIVTRLVRRQSCCQPNEGNEIQDQDAPIEEINDVILQALIDELSPQCEN
jgi:hypothetical protein